VVKNSVQDATRGTLAGLALPNCKGYHRWHNTRLKEKVCGKKEKKKKNREIKAKEKTTLRNIMVKVTVGPNSSNPPMCEPMKG